MLIRFLLFVVFSSIAFAQPADTPDPLLREDQPFDVLHYDLNLDLTAAPRTFASGECTITFLYEKAKRRHAHDTEPQFLFHLRDLTIDSVFLNGKRTNYTTHGNIISPGYAHSILIPESAPDTNKARIYYHGEMTNEGYPYYWGGVSSTDSILFSMGVCYACDYVSSTQHWMPCFDVPWDKATFTANFRVPHDFFAASNGSFSRIINTDNTITYRYNHPFASATHLLSFAIARYISVPIATGPLPITVYALQPDSAAAASQYRLVPQMVTAFEKRFGKYPFESLGYVLTPIGSMEHQTMISMDASYTRANFPVSDYINIVAAHELSHQWFGDLITCADYRHAWLNEGFASFSEALWMEDLFGFPAYIKAMEEKINSYLREIAPREGALSLYDFSRLYPSSNYPWTIYRKGAAVLGMLRYELGDSLFFLSLQNYVSAFKYGTAATEDLKLILEKTSGKNLDTFFKQWIYKAGWPILSISVLKENNDLYLTILQQQKDLFGIFQDVPVEFCLLKDGKIIASRVFRIGGETTEAVWKNVPAFDRITVNEGPSLRTLLHVKALSVR